MKYIFSFLLILAAFGSISAQSTTQNQENIAKAAGPQLEDVSQVDYDFVRYFEGKVFINNELSSVKAVLNLDQNKIQTAEIFKGQAAKTKFNEDYPVLVIKTKS